MKQPLIKPLLATRLKVMVLLFIWSKKTGLLDEVSEC